MSASRGQSEVVGLALLAGMVLVGAVILVSTGLVLLDDLERGAQTEQTESSLAVTNSRLSAAASGDTVGLQTDTLQGGSMTVEQNTTRFEFTTAHDDCTETYSFELNALEYTKGNRSWVLEGGGRWNVDPDGELAVDTAPDVGYENGALALDLLTFNQSAIDRNGEMIARGSGKRVVNRSKLMDAIRCPGGSERANAVRITVNSTAYIDAWDQHLSEAMTGGNVTYYGSEHASTSEKEVRIVIDDLVQQREARFSLVNVGRPGSSTITFDDGLELTPTIRNTGERNGSTEVSLTVDSTADSHTWTTNTGDIDSQEETTVSFDLDGTALSNIDGIDASTPGNLSQYGELNWNISTDGSTATSTVLLSYTDRAVHRVDALSHEKHEQTVTVAANLTNVGEQAGTNQLTFSLDGQSQDGSIEIDRERTFDVATDPWNESTFAIDINQSRLPYGTYTYSVDLSENYEDTDICTESPQSCKRTGQFVLSEGSAGISDLSTVRVDEPSEVSASIIGTEITFEHWDYVFDEGWVRKRGLAPVTATAVVGDRRVRFTQDGPVPVEDPHEGNVEAHNLNTVGTRDRAYEYETTLDEGAVTIEATYWDCDRYEYVNTDTYEGTTYQNYECADFDEDDYTQVTVTDGGGTSNEGFLMTRDSERADMPRIGNVLPRQRTLSEVFQDGTDDIDLENGSLTLSDTDFAFMMETTTTQSSIQYEYPRYADGWTDIDTSNQTAMNLAAWDIAQNEREADETDPDFNDVIGLVQIDPGEEYVTLDDPLSDARLTGDQQATTTTFDLETRQQTTSTDPDSVDVDVDEIVIE